MLNQAKKIILYLLGFSITFAIGCSTIIIESDPSGAVVLYSTNGIEPWNTLGNSENPLTTPVRFRRFHSGHHFFRVEKSGYAPPLPLIGETYPFHKETIAFHLKKTPQTIEKEYLAKGYIRFQNQWIDPQEQGLVEYQGEWMKPEEKFATEQRDKGLELYEGKWLTHDEKERLFARDQTAKGLTSFKGRWVTPGEKAQEEKIDLEVEDAFQKEHRNPGTPAVVGTIAKNETRIRVLNGTGDKIIFYFSGIKSFRVALDPYESQNLNILPGTYRIASSALTQNLIPSYWDFEFKSGFRYSMVEEGEPLLETVKENIEITPESIKKQYDIPELKIPDYPTSGTREKNNKKRAQAEGKTQSLSNP